MSNSILRLYQYIKIILLFLTITVKVVSSEKKIINILMKQPNMPYTLNTEEWKLEYEEKINEYFFEKSHQNSILKDVELRFNFIDYVIYEYEFYLTTTLMMEEWVNGINDLMIFDDRFLLSEVAFMESDWPLNELNNRKPSMNLLEELSNYISDYDLSFHDSKIFNDAMNEGKIYGLPYEMDFNVLYYKNENEKAKEILEDIENLTWKDTWNKLKPSFPLEIGLGDDDSFLDFFAEYANNYYNTSKEYDDKQYKLFYNDTGKELLKSFYDFLIDFGESNENNESNESNESNTLQQNEDEDEDEPLANTLWLSYDNAYLSFMNNKSTFYRGRASHYPAFQKDDKGKSINNISVSLPPKHISTVTERYVVVNKCSKQDKKLLVDIALELTSKEMQLFRAKNFGSIPTFNITKMNNDSIIESYCKLQPTICHFIQNMKRLYLKDIFKSKYSVPFYEIRVKMPVMFKQYLSVNKDAFVDIAFKIFQNLFELNTYSLGIQIPLTYIITSTVAITFFILIYFIRKYRNHPYIRVVSPNFCIMIIIGCTINMIKVLNCLPPYTIFKIKFFYVIEALGTGLIYIPMIAVTYRIFAIYQTKSFNSGYLTNKILYIAVGTLISFIVIYRIIVTLIYEFSYMPYGSISHSRYPMFYFEAEELQLRFYHSFFYVIVRILFIYLFLFLFLFLFLSLKEFLYFHLIKRSYKIIF